MNPSQSVYQTFVHFIFIVKMPKSTKRLNSQTSTPLKQISNSRYSVHKIPYACNAKVEKGYLPTKHLIRLPEKSVRF